MIRFLYLALLRLQPQRWRGEMAATFEDARAGARSEGWFAYLAFGVREIAGLIWPARERGSEKRRLGRVGFAVAGLVGGIFVGWTISKVRPELYTSRSAIRVVPAQIPGRFVPAVPELTVESMEASTLTAMYSRSTLTRLILEHNLFLPERRRLPLEDVLKIMRKRIDIRPDGHETLSIAYSDPDRFRAQRVNRELFQGLIVETMRMREKISKETVDFLAGQANRAASRWEGLDKQLRDAGGAGSARLQLDRDLARRQYETLRQQVSEAETLLDLEAGKQGPTLEALEVPSLAERTSGLSDAGTIAVSAFAGLVFGLAVHAFRRMGLSARGLPAPVEV